MSYDALSQGTPMTDCTQVDNYMFQLSVRPYTCDAYTPTPMKRDILHFLLPSFRDGSGLQLSLSMIYFYSNE